MKRWQKRVLWSAAALVILTALAWPRLQGSAEPTGPSPANRGPQSLLASVYVIEAVAMQDRIRATGTLRADESVELSAEVSGRVTRVLFQEGSYVQRGQLLLTINDQELQAQRDRLRYRIELAERREERQSRLLEIGGVSQEEYDGSLAELNVLRADYNLVLAQIERTQLRAPFTGVIGLRHVSEGAFLSPTSRIATLQALSPMKLEFSVPERFAGRISSGSQVTFTVAGYPNSFRGEVYAAEPRVDEETRTLLIRARVPNPEGRLIPGSFADVELIMEEIGDALPVPSIALVPDISGPRVWVVENGRAHPRQVQTGIRTDAVIQITAGLAAGDTVLVSGVQMVRQGQPVRIQDFAALGRGDLASSPTSADLTIPAD